jgi:hypothetical protein
VSFYMCLYISGAPRWRDGRVAEGARLESVYTGNRIVGSNPTPSAIAKREELASNFSVFGKTIAGFSRQSYLVRRCQLRRTLPSR